MKKSLLLGLGACALALGGVSASTRFFSFAHTVADDSPSLYMVGTGVEIDGATKTDCWDISKPLATATLEGGFYTINVNFTATGGQFGFKTSNDKWFAMSNYEYDGTNYPGLDLKYFDWYDKASNANIKVNCAGSYVFSFAKDTIVNTATNGDIFHVSSTRVTKTPVAGENYVYFSMGKWYGTSVWDDNTVYVYSFDGKPSGKINNWPGRKAEPVGYGLYRLLIESDEMGDKIMWDACNGSDKGEFSGGMDYSSSNKFYLHDNERTYSANITGDQAGAVILADYFLDKVTDGCDKDGITPLNKTKWDYLRGVSATLGDGAIAAFKNASTEIVAGSSRVLDAKARYQFIVDKAAYASYEDYFGMRTGAGLRIDVPLAANDSSALTPIVIASASVAALGGLFLLRKKRAE